ncbi:hypothetical protein B7494_g1584 [Chlorociboria aeruginascens]|nr:hypothetical protein B7494_g1584 [Chlorociboria aeruginascens]
MTKYNEQVQDSLMNHPNLAYSQIKFENSLRTQSHLNSQSRIFAQIDIQTRKRNISKSNLTHPTPSTNPFLIGVRPRKGFGIDPQLVGATSFTRVSTSNPIDVSAPERPRTLFEEYPCPPQTHDHQTRKRRFDRAVETGAEEHIKRARLTKENLEAFEKMRGRQRKFAGKKSSSQITTTSTSTTDKNFGPKLQRNNIVYTAFNVQAPDDIDSVKKLLDQRRKSESPVLLDYQRDLQPDLVEFYRKTDYPIEAIETLSADLAPSFYNKAMPAYAVEFTSSKGKMKEAKLQCAFDGSIITEGAYSTYTYMNKSDDDFYDKTQALTVAFNDGLIEYYGHYALQTPRLGADRAASNKVAGRPPRHLSRIGPFLERLRGYTGAINVFAQGKPEILALIWGPIKLLLQWTSILKLSLDELVKTIADIGDLLPEFEEVMKLFGHNEQMKDVLALFFQDILDIYAIALKFFWLILHTLLMRNEVRLEHIREEHEARLRAQEHFEKNERSHRKQEYNAIREAISPRIYEEELYRIRGRICIGTGGWLLRDATFTKWLKEHEEPSKLIWLQGIPGAGKTYLSSTIIGHALTRGRTLFAFLSFKFSSSTTALSIIHSLIFQLTSDDDNLQAILCQSIAKDLRRDLKRAVELLATLLSTAGLTFIVIDGLDEIDEIERARLLQCLLDLSDSCNEAKILVSSRIEADIRAILCDKAVEIRIDTQNAGSIQAFVSRRVQEWFLSRDFIPEARTEIMELLAPLSSKAKAPLGFAANSRQRSEPFATIELAGLDSIGQAFRFHGS